LADGFFQHDEASLRKLIVAIRKYRPRIVFGNAPIDRHPDHGRGSKLIKDACFLSGLRKIETEFEGKSQEPWRPKALYFYNQDFYNKPDFVVDINGFWNQKIEVLRAFGSQFYDPNSQEPKTPISGEEFFDFLHSRAMEFGRPAGYILAEGFIASRIPGVKDIFSLD
jgi:bacillithiol biosynthesis deacetylase BshB1